MKTKLLSTISLVLFCTILFAQNNVWTKDDRNNVYNECFSFIGKYPNLTTDQKEALSICYLDEITKQYTKLDYLNKIEVELRKIKETILTLCSKSLGIELSEKKKEEIKIEPPKEEGNKELPATKENLIGHWKDDNSDFWLFETNDYKIQYNDGKSARGTWKIDNIQLSLNKAKLIGKSEKIFKILLFTKNKFVYQSLNKKGETLTATKIK
jgi:hypothetical protein